MTAGHERRHPEEIERDLGDTRAEIDTTVTQIERRLSPEQLVDQALDYLRSGDTGRRLGEVIKRDEAGRAPEDAVEAGPQRRPALGASIALVRLEVGVEPPDQLPDQIDGVPLAVVVRDQLVHQPLGVHTRRGDRPGTGRPRR